jgi:hypothetical protein
MTTPDDRREQVRHAVLEGQEATVHAEQALDSKPGRPEVTRIALRAAFAVVAIGMALTLVIALFALNSAAKSAAAFETSQRDFKSNEKLAQQAFDTARQANEALSARGQTPVPIPAPDGNDPSDTIVAAATARVLASLPREGVTAEKLGQGIAAYMLANPPAPGSATPGQISESLAGYLATNPPPSGKQGEPGTDGANGQDGKDGADGKDGRTPTPQDIQDQFVAFIQANPTFLASQLCFGRTFENAKDLVAGDGSLITMYGCVVSSTPPVPPTGSTTSTTSSEGTP